MRVCGKHLSTAVSLTVTLLLAVLLVATSELVLAVVPTSKSTSAVSVRKIKITGKPIVLSRIKKCFIFVPALSTSAVILRVARFVAEAFQPGRHFLVRFGEQIDQVPHDILVLVVEERRRQAYNINRR